MSFLPKTADGNFLQSTVHTQVKETMKMSNASEFFFGMELRVFFQSVGNGAGSLAIGKIAQFWYDLGKVIKSVNFIK